MVVYISGHGPMAMLIVVFVALVEAVHAIGVEMRLHVSQVHTACQTHTHTHAHVAHRSHSY